MGDFNTRTDLQDTVDAITYGDFLDLFNLKNHVTFPTHNKDHTLDLVLTDNECTIMAEVTQGDFISDHCLIDCKLNIAKSQNDTPWRYCQKIKKMDKEKFQEDLKALLPLICQEPSVDAKTDKYHIILNSIMDKLAPLKKKRIKKDMKQPWHDEQLSNEIQLRHLKERKWKHSGNEYDYIALQYQKRHVTKIIHAKRKQYYNDLFSNIS